MADVPVNERPHAQVRSFRLVERNISGDTVAFLKALLKQAEDGDLIGFAGIMMYGPDRDFDCDAIGECRRSPFFTMGALKALEKKLEKLGGLGP